jgi:hypothetical protein
VSRRTGGGAWRAGWTALAGLLVALAAPTAARAQLNLLRTEIAPGPGGLGPVEGAEVAPPLGLSFHLALGVARRPLQLLPLVPVPLSSPVPVDWQGHGELGLALGLPAHLQVGVAIPFVFAQTEAGDASTGVHGGPGDVRIEAKWQALRLGSTADQGLLPDGGEGDEAGTSTPPVARQLLLAIKLIGTIPGGTPGRFLSDEGFTLTPGTTLQGRLGPVTTYLDLGVRVRGERTYLDVHQGHELRFGIGLAGRVHPQVELGAALFGGSTLADKTTTPVEALGLVRGHLGPVELTLAGGGAVVDGVGAPSWRVLALLRYRGDWLVSGEEPPATFPPLSGPPLRTGGDVEPGGGPEVLPRTRGRLDSGGDRDGDGVPDAVDRCPDEPEDIDGFQDEDGCPDPDNDQDGVPDVSDACPNVPGPAWNRGCP